MSDDGNVLPQAEIDTLFKQATGRSISSPPGAGKTSPGETPGPLPPPAAPPSSGSPKKPEAVAPASVPAQPPAPTSAPAAPAAPAVTSPTDDILRVIQTTLDDLTKRIERAEANINRLNHKEGEVTDYSGSVQQLSQDMEVEAENLQKVNGQVDRVLRGLKGTPGYGVRSDFTCESCGSHGFVAILMRCTSCGSEGWWGWWPEEK